MFDQAITKNAKSTLAILGKADILPPKTYLAGGTALAIQLGHRISYDLDFFTNENFDRQTILPKLGQLQFSLEREDKGTILGKINETKFSLFYYPYPLISETLNYQDIQIANIQDIAAMKVDAISGRGKRRDFIDLYYISKQISLSDSLELYDKKYKKLSTNKFHILKSLDYFVDADAESESEVLIEDYSWNKVKKFFQEETIKIAKELN